MNWRAAITPNPKHHDWYTDWLPWILIGGSLLLTWVLLPSKILPGPVAVIAALPSLWGDSGLGQELWTSLSLNLEAAALTVFLSLTVAYSSRVPLFAPVSTIFSNGRFNSFVGLPLVLTLWIGNAHMIKVVLLSIAMSVFSVPAIIDVIHNIPRESYDDGRVLRMNEWQVLWEVVVLGKFDEVIDVLRTNLSMGWMMLPMVEGIFRSEGGIGVLLLTENKYFRLDHVFAIIGVVGLLGFAIDKSVGGLKHWICPYAFVAKESA